MNAFQNYTILFDCLAHVISENTYQDWKKIHRRILSCGKEIGDLSEICYWSRVHGEVAQMVALSSTNSTEYDQLIKVAIDSYRASSTVAGQLNMRSRDCSDLPSQQFWQYQRAEALYLATESMQDKETLQETFERALTFYLSSASMASKLILQCNERGDMAQSYSWRSVRGRLYRKVAEIAPVDRNSDEYLSRALADFRTAESLAGLMTKKSVGHENLADQFEWRRKRAEVCGSAADLLMQGGERSKKISAAHNLYKKSAALARQLANLAREANQLKDVQRWRQEQAELNEIAAKYVDNQVSVEELQKASHDYYLASATAAGQLCLQACKEGDLKQHEHWLEVRAKAHYNAARLAETKESKHSLEESASGYFNKAAELAHQLAFDARNANIIADVQLWLGKYSSLLFNAAALTSDDSIKRDGLVKEGLVGIDLMYDYKLSGQEHAPILLPKRLKRRRSS